MKKKQVSLLLILCLFLSCLTAVRPQAAAAVDVTYPGAGAGISAVRSGDTLTVSGSGGIHDFEVWKTPWMQENETNMTTITKLVVGEGVTSIGTFAFHSLKALKSVTLPDSLLSIHKSAFWDCQTLEEITLPKNVKEIGEDVFYACYDLKNVYVASGSKSYASMNGVLFTADMKNLVCYPAGRSEKACTLPDTVKNVGVSAFINNTTLKTIDLGSGAETIGNYAFEGCSSLTQLYVPVTLKSIGELAFAKRDQTNKLTILYEGDASQWKKIAIAEGNDLLEEATVKYKAEKPAAVAVKAPETKGSCGKNTSWQYADGTLTIGGTGSVNAFEDYSALPWSAFRSEIKTLKIEAGVTGFGTGSLSHLPALTKVTVASGNKACKAVDGVLFSKKKTSLVLYPAARSGSSYTVPASVTTVGPSAFAGAKELNQIYLSDKVKTIDTGAFASCTGLASIRFPAKLASIAADAFDSCTSLTDVYYKGTRKQWESVTIREDGNAALKRALVHCGDDTGENGSATAVPAVDILAEGICGSDGYTGFSTTEDWRIHWTDNLTWTLDAEGTLTIRGAGSLCHCVQLSYGGRYIVTSPWWEYTDQIRTLVIEEGLTSISTNAFRSCGNLTQIWLPSTLKTVFGTAFYGCTNISQVCYAGSGAAWNSVTFYADSSDKNDINLQKLNVTTGTAPSAAERTAAPEPVPCPAVKKITAQSKGFLLTWKEAAGASGYQVRYSTKSSMAGAKTADSSETTKTVSGLKAKKKYYVQVRTWALAGDGTKVWSDWSVKKTVKTK